VTDDDITTLSSSSSSSAAAAAAVMCLSGEVERLLDTVPVVCLSAEPLRADTLASLSVVTTHKHTWTASEVIKSVSQLIKQASNHNIHSETMTGTEAW